MRSTAESDRVLLLDIPECNERVQEYTREGREAFLATRMAQDALVRNLQTLAESTQRLSAGLKERERTVPSRAIAGFRNVLVHGYLGVDPVMVWSVVEGALPGLSGAVKRLQDALGDGGET